jgi:hypothetical protein
VNDHEAIEAINAVLDRYFRGEVTQVQALATICSVTGENKIPHDEVKEAK